MIVLTPNGKYKFTARDGSNDQCDEAVIKETWVENVYHIVRGDLDDTGVLIDLGANIGSVSVYAAALNDENEQNPDLPRVKVIAVEPEPDNLRYLQQNIDDNGVADDVVIYPVAVSQHQGTGYIVEKQGNSTLEFTPQPKSTKIPVVRLIDVFADNNLSYCDVLKMDIEGAEYSVIAGADLDTLRKVKYITLEFDAATDSAFGQMISKLAKVFNLHIVGSPERGGYIFGRRY